MPLPTPSSAPSPVGSHTASAYPSGLRHRATFFQSEFTRMVLPPLCSRNGCFTTNKPRLFYQPPCSRASSATIGRTSAGYLAARNRCA